MAHNTTAASIPIKTNDRRRNANEWTPDEHARYLEALERFPNGPWKARAAFIGTRTTRQVMTHYQKITMRLKRHARGLLPTGRPCGAMNKPYVKVEPHTAMAPPDAVANTAGSTGGNSLHNEPAQKAVNLPTSPVSPASSAFAVNAWVEGDVVFDPLDGELQGTDPFPWTVL